MATLRRLYSEHGSEHTQQQVTTVGTQWHRSKHLFEPCTPSRYEDSPNPHLCKCERIQEFAPKNAFGRIKVPGKLPHSGAVIFGQGSSPWSKDLTSSWSSIRDSLRGPAIELRNRNEALERASDRTQRLSLSESPYSRPKEETREPSLRVTEDAPQKIARSTVVHDTYPRTTRPASKTARYVSFQSSNQTTGSSSTERSSRTSTTDAGYRTPATSYNAGSNTDCTINPSTINRTSNQRRYTNNLEKEDQYQLQGGSHPNPNIVAGKSKRVQYCDMTKCTLPSLSQYAMKTMGRPRPSFICQEEEEEEEAEGDEALTKTCVLPPDLKIKQVCPQPQFETRGSHILTLAATSSAATSQTGIQQPPVLRRKRAFKRDIAEVESPTKN
ncbi:uncharacterized protein LY89DRAFT_729978 [Mollisia scopiformis]|uniref:Uncharacterized protein n=1 Tax=Mollisia scopiformis TaxID=149040 RepID=A0A194XM21_MOLSC|nr:uncharacterized protein LY89DRAFT_729978 [Mollisia scopiformis]KUJ21186.1 hypothetical protein LY89DRAFT_729978 [Mollisia scopiformis]